ncbi:MAG: hypothetical protein Q3983_07440 [Capnocytophaga sp.]|nr:hypothetical protein [Capnocytophaga sp.]
MKINRNSKDVITGIIVGIIANSFGILLWWALFTKMNFDFWETIQIAYEERTLSAIIGLGALLNLLAFFGFIRLSFDYKARGVLIATFISAFIILILKFI